MKAIKIKDINTKTRADLTKMLAEGREALRIFRFGATGAKTKNVKEGRTIRKNVARILTVMNSQKE